MGFNLKKISLKERMDDLNKESSVKVAVILVDETTTDDNKSNDRDSCHKHQAAILKKVALLKFGVFIVQYGCNGENGFTAEFRGGLGKVLDDEIGSNVTVYYKGTYESDGFKNIQLVADIKGYTHAIIMGQSINACCAATARGAKTNGLSVLTCKDVMRGGSVATISPEFLGAACCSISGWPDETDLHPVV